MKNTLACDLSICKTGQPRNGDKMKPTSAMCMLSNLQMWTLRRVLLISFNQVFISWKLAYVIGIWLWDKFVFCSYWKWVLEQQFVLLIFWNFREVGHMRELAVDGPNSGCVKVTTAEDASMQLLKKRPGFHPGSYNSCGLHGWNQGIKGAFGIAGECSLWQRETD